MYRIAIVEDDVSTSEIFRDWLLQRWPDAQIEEFGDLQSGSMAIESASYDLVIADIDLGRGDRYGGVRIASMLQGKSTPVLIVSGLPQPDLHRDVLMALDAWDYLQKPVTESDFLNQAKRALQWRADRLKGEDSTAKQVPQIGDPDLLLDPFGRIRVSWKGKRVGLSITQVRVVGVLVSNANQVVEYSKLYNVLDSGQNIENLRVHMQAIRNAFKDADPEFKRILNVPMVGYTWRTN